MNTAKDICKYIAVCDYFDYHVHLNTWYGITPTLCFKNLARWQRVMRHKMYTIAFEMILRGDY